MRTVAPLIVALAAAACSGERGRPPASCGIAAMATPASVLAQFGVPRQTLSRPPRALPERMVARIAGGGVLTAFVGRSAADSLLIVGIEGEAPTGLALGFGVLLVDPKTGPRGVMLFEGLPVEAAPVIGTVSMGSMNAPLLGVEADPASYEDPGCPIFPDSAIR